MSDDEGDVSVISPISDYEESKNSDSESPPNEVGESYQSSSKPENKTSSWFDKLKAPRSSDLARKRKIHPNPPPVGKKRSHTTNTGKRNYDPKKVSPSERVREFPAENLTVSGGKL